MTSSGIGKNVRGSILRNGRVEKSAMFELIATMNLHCKLANEESKIATGYKTWKQSPV